MRLKISVYALLMTVVFIMSSCLGDTETDYEIYDDTAVTSMSFGALKCTFHTTKKNSTEDSTYIGNLTTASYPIQIDQLKREISNVDSLPVGTDMAHILLNVTTKNNGIATLKSLTSDSVTVISNSDSLDFSQPRELIVYSYSGNYHQTYKVNFNIHNERADDFRWQSCTKSAQIAAYEKVKSLAFGGYIYVLGTIGDVAGLVRVSTENTTSAWSTVDVKVGDDVPVAVSLSAKASFITAGERLLLLDGGRIYATADGESWSDIEAPGIAKLLGICGEEMFALSDAGEMMVSMDGGASWKADAIDSDKSYLPSQDVSCMVNTLPTNKDVSRIVMIGNRNESVYAGDKTAVVWSKIVEKDWSKDQDWAYNGFDEKNYHALPCLSGLSVVSYVNGLMAIGGKGIAGSQNKGFTQMYYSIDNGITWHKNSSIGLPDKFDAVNASLAVDENSYIWIVCTGSGEVWRGRLNKLGWAQKPGYVKE